MSQHEKTADRPPVERSQAGTTINRQTHRLYPSLPNIDWYEVCLPGRSIGENLHTAAVDLPDSLLGDNKLQLEVSPASRDVRMKAQILILEEQRQELLSINEKWAKEYRTMRQYYKEKVQDLKALLQQSQFEEETWEGGENHFTLHKKVKESTWTRDTDVSSELVKAEKEARELRVQNSTLTRRGQRQHEEIRRLNKALDEALQTTQPLDVSSETLHDIWKHQAEVYKEDFLKERRDREKLKEKYLELENKFRKVHSELRVLKSQVTSTRPPKPLLECTCANGTRSPNWEVRPSNRDDIQRQRRYTLDDKL
ncbi:TNFAIP3-interacting protein 1-like isoform X1 [Micropterus salmoides]|uniref:TNFAIP3-interacting protein 1-like isoform X1 n=1 Tax=Micropterus salmoides TaxID=27706 RepID=UPI0018ECEF2A|nr:TNFAIP3-interacting protein 1-like isoform X1 [Micropterus salmoides]